MLGLIYVFVLHNMHYNALQVVDNQAASILLACYFIN